MNRARFLPRNFEYLFSFDLKPGDTSAEGASSDNESVYNALDEAQVRGEAALQGRVERSHQVLRFPGSSEAGELSGRVMIRTREGHLIEGTYQGVVRVREPWTAVGVDREARAYVSAHFETGAKYEWLSKLQCIGYGNVMLKGAALRFATFDLYSLGSAARAAE